LIGKGLGKINEDAAGFFAASVVKGYSGIILTPQAGGEEIH